MPISSYHHSYYFVSNRSASGWFHLDSGILSIGGQVLCGYDAMKVEFSVVQAAFDIRHKPFILSSSTALESASVEKLYRR